MQHTSFSKLQMGAEDGSRRSSCSEFAAAPKSVDVGDQKFPMSIVWAPLWPITCFCPCVGHMGIGDSQGRVHDFAGPYCVNCDAFMVGDVYRYAHVDADPRSWDRGIAAADTEYRGRCHNICCDNCHHHTAMALSEAGHKHGCISAWLYCCMRGTWTGKDKCALALVAPLLCLAVPAVVVSLTV